MCQVSDDAARDDAPGITRATLLRRGALTGAGLVGAELLGPRLAASAAAETGPPCGLGRDVTEFLERHSPRFLVDHCERSAELAMLFAAAMDLDVDEEVLFAGVMLHDLGLVPEFHSPSVRFEVASADAARSFVLDRGMSKRRAETVWDVAALHGTGGIATHKSPETAAAYLGIGADVTGDGLDQFDQAKVARIMRTRPGFARPFIDAIVADLLDKPQVASSTWMTTIAADHIPGFHQSSIEQLALDDPFEQPPSH